MPPASKSPAKCNTCAVVSEDDVLSTQKMAIDGDLFGSDRSDSLGATIPRGNLQPSTILDTSMCIEPGEAMESQELLTTEDLEGVIWRVWYHNDGLH